MKVLKNISLFYLKAKEQVVELNEFTKLHNGVNEKRSEIKRKI